MHFQLSTMALHNRFLDSRRCTLVMNSSLNDPLHSHNTNLQAPSALLNYYIFARMLFARNHSTSDDGARRQRQRQYKARVKSISCEIIFNAFVRCKTVCQHMRKKKRTFQSHVLTHTTMESAAASLHLVTTGSRTYESELCVYVKSLCADIFPLGFANFLPSHPKLFMLQWRDVPEGAVSALPRTV